MSDEALRFGSSGPTPSSEDFSGSYGGTEYSEVYGERDDGRLSRRVSLLSGTVSSSGDEYPSLRGL